MQQTRLVSLIETLLNTALGFVVSFIGWPIAAALTGIQYSHGQHWAVVGFFTVLSVARGYVVRRFFNAGLHLAAVRLAGKIVKPRDIELQAGDQIEYDAGDGVTKAVTLLNNYGKGK